MKLSRIHAGGSPPEASRRSPGAYSPAVCDPPRWSAPWSWMQRGMKQGIMRLRPPP